MPARVTVDLKPKLGADALAYDTRISGRIGVVYRIRGGAAMVHDASDGIEIVSAIGASESCTF